MVGSRIDVKKGLDCTERTNKLTLDLQDKTGNSFDGCDAISGGAPWALWKANKWGSSITAANAALIHHAEVKAKGASFGTCNLSGSPNAAGTYIAGDITFKDAAGEMVKQGKGSFVARSGVDIPRQSIVFDGIMSKGFGVGSVLRVLVGVHVNNAANGDLLGCNIGTLCPPGLANPIKTIFLSTNEHSRLRIGLPANADCTADGDPWDCCSGFSTGTCNDD
jgi:hypothetical protein